MSFCHESPDKRDRLQSEWLYQYSIAQWNVSEACRATGITRATYYRWMDRQEFRDLITNIQEEKIDFIESKLLTLVDNLSVPATIFALKCLGKARGYIDRPAESTPTEKVDWNELGKSFANAASQIATKKPE